MSGSSYDVPSWAGKPPTGVHLDVLKEGKLVQKLMIDEKRCYLFGRNSQLNDFCIDHQSCSRVHAALVYHKHLHRAFLVDLGSTHGTFIGHVRLEGNKPTQLPVDSTFHFGASTRYYCIRERPQAGPRPIMEELEKSANSHESSAEGALLGLPETETELDNLTEFNTAHNRRITMLGIGDDGKGKKKRKIRITFNEDEEIINPEDVDPSVGRFRNMIETTIIPKKRPHSGGPGLLGSFGGDHRDPSSQKRHHSGSSSAHHPGASLHSPTSHHPASRGLYDGLDSSAPSLFSSSLTSKLGLPMPNPAPDIEMAPPVTSMLPPPPPQSSAAAMLHHHHMEQMQQQMQLIEDPDEPKKKKYAKEAWPGRKPTPSLLG